MSTRQMQIGEAATRAGVNVQTLRYYERRGLLSAPVRSSTSNYRLYDEQAVRQVRFVKNAQSLGFTLQEIGELAVLRESSDQPCTDLRERAEEKIVAIEEKLEQLRAMKHLLSTLISTCSGGVDRCPVLDNGLGE